MNLEFLQNSFFNIVLAVQGVFLFLCMIKSIIGPSVSDRLVAVNMAGTNAIAIIAVLAVRLGESYLADIGLIYAMISFLAIVLLTKVYMGAYKERKSHEMPEEEENT